ncbi:MAG: VanZ family protein [Planctomycetes bacterium]|nr:VanZ family protein [Planctomycetota bacterium]
METAEEHRRAPRGARIMAWGLAAGWAALIFVASSIPRGAGVPLPGAGTDKVVHAGVFAVLGALLALALRAEGLRRWRAAGAAALLGLAYGALDEVHQAFTPGRSMDAEDVVADAAGAALGALVGSGRAAEVVLARWPREERR